MPQNKIDPPRSMRFQAVFMRLSNTRNLHFSLDFTHAQVYKEITMRSFVVAQFDVRENRSMKNATKKAAKKAVKKAAPKKAAKKAAKKK